MNNAPLFINLFVFLHNILSMIIRCFLCSINSIIQSSIWNPFFVLISLLVFHSRKNTCTSIYANIHSYITFICKVNLVTLRHQITLKIFVVRKNVLDRSCMASRGTYSTVISFMLFCFFIKVWRLPSIF